MDLKKFLVQDRVLDRVHNRVQDKVGLENFHQNHFLQKKLKISMFDGEIVKKKFPLKNILDLKIFLVQDRVQDRVLDRILDRVHDRVQDKVAHGNFSPRFFFCKKP